jgi:transposase
LIFFRLLTDEPYSYANSWINANYAKFLFPNCSLDSQRISEYLSYLGHNIDLNKFFRHYLEMIYKNDEPCGIIIDSTGAQNDISIDLTQINNHNGIINNEIRLIYVIDRIKKIPIYYRVIAGNIIDVTTLQNTINKLKSFKVDIKYSVLDAGYYSEDNIRYLFKQNIGFVTRMIPSRLIAKELISENLEKIFHMKNKIIHNNRLLFVEKFKRELFGNIVYAYVAIDFKKRNEEIFNLANSTNKCKKLSTDELELEKKTAGTFILLSSLDLDIIEILPYYSSRNYIEQIFDVSKNNAQLLPLRVHSTEALMGHILINFLTVIGYLEVNKYFNLAKYCAKKALFDLSFLFGRVINNEINIYEPNKTMKEIAKILGIIIPKFLDTSNIYKAN